MKTNSRLKKAYYSTLTSVIYQIASIICGFVLPGLILKAYGSSYNGVIASITQFLGFFSVLQTGIQGSTRVALYKTLASNNSDGTNAIINANVKYYRKISIILIGYIILLAIIFPLMLDEGISDIDIVLLVIIIGASSFLQYFYGNAYKAFLSAAQASYVLNILQTITIVGNTLISAFIIFNNGSVIIAKLGSSFIYALNPIAIYIYINRHYKLDKKVTPDKTALNGRWDVLANSLANIVHENVDILFITIFCNAAEVSVYSIYNLISNGLIRLMQVFTNGIEAAFGNMWAKKEIEILNMNFRKYEYVMFSVADILTGCMIVLIIPFVKIYTKNINDVNYIRPFLALFLTIALATMCIRVPYVTVVQAAGHYKQTKKGSIAEAIINIALTLVLIQYFGIEGAVMGTIVANIFRSLQYGYYVSKHIIHRSFAVILQRLFWFIGTVFLSIVVTFCLINKITISGWLEWIIAAAICCLVHIVILLISSLVFYSKDCNNMLNSLFKMIKN